jgi:hypothetical protein
MKMSKPNLFGKILNAIRIARMQNEEKVVKDLWDRNGLGNPLRRDGYKIEEDIRSTENGTQRTMYRLWKLVDQSELVMRTEITTEVVTGIPKGKGDGTRQDDRVVPANNTNSPL